LSELNENGTEVFESAPQPNGARLARCAKGRPIDQPHQRPIFQTRYDDFIKPVAPDDRQDANETQEPHGRRL